MKSETVIVDSDLEYAGGVANQSLPLVWVIDGQCLYDAPVPNEYSLLFLDGYAVLDISSEYPEWDGIVVQFSKNNIPEVDLKTTEYFGSILLSNPQVVNLLDFPYGQYVISPDATFDGESFTITNRDMTHLMPWPVGYEK